MNGGHGPENLCTVKTVQCSCGYTASGETADELLADVEAHISAVHAPTEPVADPAHSEAVGDKRVGAREER
jgi:predicted small metal-binding protein